MVDNASTDGTGEWLAADGRTRGRRPGRAPSPRTAAAPAASTTGSPGRVERGADLVWLMDDDGLPEPDCLEHAARPTTDLDFWGPVVVDEDDPGRLVFPIRLPGGTRVVHRLADVERGRPRRPDRATS